MSIDMKGRQSELFDLLSCKTDGGDIASRLQLADRYLDPFPEDVEGSFLATLSYLEQLGQYEKVEALRLLWKKGLSNAKGTVYEQADYGHRVLLFLTRLSGKSAQDSRVDGNCRRVIQEYCGAYTVEDRIRVEDERTLRELYREDEETEEGQWWRQQMVYSSGDELSDWSSNSEDGHDIVMTEEEGEEILASPAPLVVDDGVLIHELVDEATRYMDESTKPVIREDTWKVSGVEAVWKTRQQDANVYRPSSLSVWLASKRCTSHLSDALNPRYCVSESVFVTQMMNCIQGCLYPGFVCCLEEEGYVMKCGVHLENVSVDTLEHVAHEALGLANELKRIERHAEFLRNCIDPVVDSQSVALSHAHALDRQLQVCREYCKKEAHGRSLIALLHAIYTIRPVSRVMDHVCRVMQSGKDHEYGPVKDVVDEMQILVESLHLECSSGWTAVVMGVVMEILLAMLIPYMHAMDTMMRYGSSCNLPRECRDIAQDGPVTACPSMIEKPLRDIISISTIVPRLTDGSSVDEVCKIAGMVLDIFCEYMDNIEVGHMEHKGHHLLEEESTDDVHLCWWNKVWMSEINEQDVALTKEYTSHLALPGGVDQYFVPSPQYNSAFDAFACVNNGFGSQVSNRMVHASQRVRESFMTSSRNVSNFCSVDHIAARDESSLDTMTRRVMDKIDALFASSSSSFGVSDPLVEGPWPFPPTSQVTDMLSNMVLSHSATLGKMALQGGITEQIDAAKSTVLLDDFLWGRLVSGLLDSCSSRPGLDAIAISNTNTVLTDILDMKLRKYISSAWIECRSSSNGIQTSFASRTTSYLKLLQWNVTFRPPLDAIIEKESLESMSDMRDLVLQLQWVWKTLSSAKAICIKLGGTTVTKQTHASLLSMLTLLRQIMNYVYASFEKIFSDVTQRIQDTENITQMKMCLHTRLSQQGPLSPTMPLRANLEKWIDACLHYGILVSRSIVQSCGNGMYSAALSPSTKSFEGGISSAEADVTAAQSAIVPIFQQVVAGGP